MQMYRNKSSFNIYNGNEPVAYELQVIRARSCLVSAHNVGMDQTKAVIKPNFETWEQICKLKNSRTRKKAKRLFGNIF